jgi:hypothetical protein
MQALPNQSQNSIAQLVASPWAGRLLHSLGTPLSPWQVAHHRPAAADAAGRSQDTEAWAHSQQYREALIQARPACQLTAVCPHCIHRAQSCCTCAWWSIRPPLTQSEACQHAHTRHDRVGGGSTQRCAVPCCAVLCCAVLCCAVLCCAVLCCAVLCCAVLCCAVLSAVVAVSSCAAAVSSCADKTRQTASAQAAGSAPAVMTARNLGTAAMTAPAERHGRAADREVKQGGPLLHKDRKEGSASVKVAAGVCCNPRQQQPR